jgi:hypothetical protein
MQHTKIDHRSTRGHKLATRLNRQTILSQMPKIYFVKDSYASNYRVGRSDNPGDCFEIVQTADFDSFRKVYEALGFTLYDNTDGTYDEGFE